MTRSLVRVVLALVVAGALAPPLSAQRGPDSRRGTQNRAELEERFRAHAARMIQERLGLDEVEADALGEVVRSFERRRRELARSEFTTRRRVEALVAEGADDHGAAQELLDRLVELRARESALFAEEQAALLEVLTPGQVLQLHEIRAQLGQRIRALRNRDGEGGRRRGGGGIGNVDGLRGVGLSL